jgi:hypothetical protein
MQLRATVDLRVNITDSDEGVCLSHIPHAWQSVLLRKAISEIRPGMKCLIN